MLGEIYASRYLRYHGCEILSANYKSKSGEIDLIALDDDVICFVEVKTRSENAYFLPGEAVGHEKAENVKNTAAAYMAKYKLDFDVRFDLIEIILLSDDEYKLRHTKNAF